MGEENKYEGARDPIKLFLEDSLKKQSYPDLDNFPRSFNGCPLAVHIHPTTTLEVPLLLRYK
jgi:hypothetical protein